MSFVSPLDLLTVSGIEQDVIRCLVRRPKLTAVEIANFTKIPLKELDALLKEMVRESRLVQLMQNDKICFDVSLGNDKTAPKPKAKSNSVLDMLFP